MSGRHPKHRPYSPARRWSYHYEGRHLLAVVEQRPDGWHVTSPRGDQFGIFPSREAALAFVTTLPITQGECP